jgi:hypothetical protein
MAGTFRTAWHSIGSSLPQARKSHFPSESSGLRWLTGASPQGCQRLAVGINNDLLPITFPLLSETSAFTLNTVMKNFIPWLAGSSVSLNYGDIHADRLVTSSFAREKRKSNAA